MMINLNFPTLTDRYRLQCPGPEWVGDLLDGAFEEPQDLFTPASFEDFQPLYGRPTFAPPAAPLAPAPAAAPKKGYNSQKAVDFALSLRGRRSDSLHEASRTFWNPTGFHSPGTNLNDNNCANFVSGVLRKGGGLSKHQTGVKQLEEQLVTDGWTQVPEGQAPRPGDVWVCNDRLHVELVAEVDGRGGVKTVGSNNRTVDGESGQWVGLRTKPEGTGFYMTPGRPS